MLEVTSSAIRVRDVEKRQDGSRKPSFLPLRSHFAPSLLLPGQVQNFRTGATYQWMDKTPGAGLPTRSYRDIIQ